MLHSNEGAKLRDCFSYLKSGFDNNEFLFMMMDCLSKDEVIERIAKEQNFGSIKDFEGLKDDIIITTPKERYYTDADFNAYGILKGWEFAFSNASKGVKGTSGICRCYCVFYRGYRKCLNSI